MNKDASISSTSGQMIEKYLKLVTELMQAPEVSRRSIEGLVCAEEGTLEAGDVVLLSRRGLKIVAIGNISCLDCGSSITCGTVFDLGADGSGNLYVENVASFKEKYGISYPADCSGGNVHVFELPDHEHRPSIPPLSQRVPVTRLLASPMRKSPKDTSISFF